MMWAMTTKTSGGRLSAMLIAAGVLLWAASPVRANDVQADDTDTRAIEQPAEAESAGKPVILNKYSKRKRSARAARAVKPRVLAKGYRRKAPEIAAVPMNENDNEPSEMTETVANANAQWPSPDKGIQPVTTPNAAKPDVVASDQLNDLDKKLAEPATGDDAASLIASKMAQQVAQNSSQAAGVNVPTTATPAMSAMASADRPEIASSDDNAWSQSSLIGKIFIAFGGLLTVASAARMFMA